MTANTTEQERAEFEAWALSKMRRKNPRITPAWLFLRNERNEYSSYEIALAFSAWQAARRAPAVPVPVPVPQDAMDAEHWAELHRLRVEVKRSDGTPWQTVAAQERVECSRLRAMLAAVPPLVAEYETHLARCRDAFTLPEPNSDLDNLWVMAMGCPLSVAEYVEAVAKQQSAPAVPKGWLPTPENINALSDPLRSYICDLEKVADPSGMVRQNTILRDQVAGLQVMYRKAADALAAAPQPPDACKAQSKCDTPGYCRSVMRCTAMDEKRAGGTNAN